MSISANPFAHHQLFPLSCGSDNSENIKSNTRQTYQSLLTPLHSINCSPYPVGMTIVKTSNQTLDKHINRCQHLCTASKECSPYPVGMMIVKTSSQTLDKHQSLPTPLHSIETVFPVSSISGSNSARNTKTYQSHLPRA